MQKNRGAAYRGLAARQFGVISRRQLLAFGLSRHAVQRLVASGHLRAVLPAVYHVGGAPQSWHSSLAAAFVWAGQGAVVSHRSAAALWQLIPQTQALVEVTVPRSKRSPRSGIVLHTATLDGADAVRMPPFVLTNVTRTLFDLGGVMPAEAVEEAMDAALRRGLTTVERLLDCLDRNSRTGRPGGAVFRELLARRGSAVPESVMERRLLRIIREAGLPEPVCQHSVFDGSRFVARIDFAYPEHRVGIEADGYRWHHSRKDFERDRRRASELAALGWRLIFATWREMCSSPDTVVNRIRSLLNFCI